MLLAVAPLQEVFFEFAGPLDEVFLLQTDSSEAEGLAVRDGFLAVLGMATIHTEILVFVRGFDMQVSLDPVILQVDPCVEEGDVLGRLGGNKFNGWVVTVKALYKGV